MSQLSEYMMQKRLDLLDGELEYGTIGMDGDDAFAAEYIEHKREQYRHDFWEGEDEED